MSTFTTNYLFEKPDFDTEHVDPLVYAENMIKAERALINIELGSSTGRDNVNHRGWHRNTSGSAVAANTDSGYIKDEMTWSTITGTSTWTTNVDLDTVFGAPSLGLVWSYTTGSFDIYHAGYYRITWNVRLQMSNTTMSEGLVRACLWGSDGLTGNSTVLGIIGSPVVVAMNTITNITDVGAEQLIKVTQPERTSELNNAYTYGKNKYQYWDNNKFTRNYSVAFAHNNSSSATATPLLDETYIHLEFVRGL